MLVNFSLVHHSFTCTYNPIPNLSLTLYEPFLHLRVLQKNFSQLGMWSAENCEKRMQVSPRNSDIIITQALGKSLKRHLHQHWHACGV
jgi:hypothetical protein